MPASIRIISLVLLVSTACCSREQPAAPAPAAAPAAPAAPAPVAAPEAPVAAPANPAEAAQQAMQQAMGAMQAMNQMGAAASQQMGPPVNWRKLAPFVPEKIGDFEASGELDGSTHQAGAVSHTQVRRRYKAGNKRLSIEIIDTSLTPFMRAPFAMAAMIQEDSSKGYRKGFVVKGQQGVAEWNNKRQQSEAHILAGGRFLVNIEVDGATAGESEKLAEKLDMQALSALQPKAAAAAKPAPSATDKAAAAAKPAPAATDDDKAE